MESWLKAGAYMGVRSVYGQRHSSPGDRVSEDRNGKQKKFGSGEGGV